MCAALRHAIIEVTRLEPQEVAVLDQVALVVNVALPIMEIQAVVNVAVPARIVHTCCISTVSV